MENNTPILYFDQAATTSPYEEVLATYLAAKKEYFANPSSIHREGQKAANALLKARESVKKLLHLSHHDVLFTSGATESNNLAIKGYCLRYQKRGKHIITSQTEHPSVLEAFRQLEKEAGFEVTYLKPDGRGIIPLEIVKSAVKENTILVSLMHVNNETGAVNPVEEIGRYLAAFPKIAFHVDGVQAIGKLDQPINFDLFDLYTFTGHKINGLLGTGVLLKRNNLDLLPLSSGGGQENGFRSGTNDVAGALGLVKALELTLKHQKENYLHAMELVTPLVTYLTSRPDLYEMNSPVPIQNPYIVNFSLKTKKASVVVEALSNQGIMVSSVSACHSSKERVSYVISAMGKSDELAHQTIRVSLGHNNVKEEMDKFLEALDKIIQTVRY